MPAGPDLLLDRLPPFDPDHLLDAGEADDRGGGNEDGRVADWTTIAARANEPGRRAPSALGTSASTIRVRLSSLIEGLMRATLPVRLVGTPSTVSSTGWPTRTPSASRSGTESFSRNGWTRTRTATGAPAAR